MASSGTTIAGKVPALTDNDDNNEPTGVGVIQWGRSSMEILDTLSFGRADSSAPDNDSIAGTTTGIGLMVETPTTGTEEEGGAGGVEV